MGGGMETTRADEKTEFSNNDEITITIDGDESGKSYIYKYDGTNWNPKDDENRLLITNGTTEVKITAKYDYADYSVVQQSRYPLRALANRSIATATISYAEPNAKLEFKHEACKVLINIIGVTSKFVVCYASVHDSTITTGKSQLSDELDFLGTPVAIYIPPTAEYISCTLYDPTVGTETFQDCTATFSSIKLEAGKTYSCQFVFGQGS
jgi:hypothetical protein